MMSNFMYEKEHTLTRAERTTFTSSFSFAELRDALLTD